MSTEDVTAERERLSEEIAEVLLRHQRIPLYNSGPGRNRCVGCDNLHGETDGSNSPRHVAHLADALADLLAARDRRVRAEAESRTLLEFVEWVETNRAYTKAQALALVDAWTTERAAAICWPMTVEDA